MWSRSRPKRRNFQSNLRFCPESQGGGVGLSLGLRRSGCVSISPEADSHPVVLRRNAATQSQEFVLLFSSDAAGLLRDIVRQQSNFNAPAAEHETEDYAVKLSAVRTLELNIVPDTSGRSPKSAWRRSLLFRAVLR